MFCIKNGVILRLQFVMIFSKNLAKLDPSVIFSRAYHPGLKSSPPRTKARLAFQGGYYAYF